MDVDTRLGWKNMGETDRAHWMEAYRGPLRKINQTRKEIDQMNKTDKVLYGGFAIIAMDGIVAMLVSISPLQK